MSHSRHTNLLLQTSYPQFVLLGDSLFKNAIEIRGGFSFQAAVQTRMSNVLVTPSHEHRKT